MMRSTVGLAILLSLFSRTAWSAESVLTGQLADTQGQITYVGSAAVFLCDGRTGLPIQRDTRKPMPIDDMVKSGLDSFWTVTTDDRGLFEFVDVLPGEYRLVAVSWAGTTGLPRLPGPTSAVVVLNGVVDNVVVREGEKVVAYPRQLGQRVLRITNSPEQAGAFLLISRGPTLGDGILGPYGWGDDFVRQLIGVTHMSVPYVTILGLPDDGDIHVGLLNYDNHPGVGAGRYPATVTQGQLRIVASWSDGHKAPPPELQKLTDYLAKSKLTARDFVSNKSDIKTYQDAQMRLVADLRRTPRQEVEVPGWGPQKLADVIAALAYVELQRGR